MSSSPDASPPGTRPPDHGRDEAEPGAAIGWGLALVGAGVLWLLALAGVPVRLELVLPAALAVVGLLLLLGHRWIAAGGLVAVGIALAVATLLVVAVPGPVALGAGERQHTITAPADLEDRYGLGLGSMTIDLTDLDLPEGATELSARVMVGELVIRVPPDVEVTGDGRAVIGEIAAFDRANAGILPRATISGESAADRVLALDVGVVIGRIEVTR